MFTKCRYLAPSKAEAVDYVLDVLNAEHVSAKIDMDSKRCDTNGDGQFHYRRVWFTLYPCKGYPTKAAHVFDVWYGLDGCVYGEW